MQKEIVLVPEMKLLGITARTSLKGERNPDTAKIPETVQRYFFEGLFEKIPNRARPGVTYCAYTDYESDEYGEYTYFVGEVVSALEDVPEGFSTLIIPAQKYAKFTNGPESMPKVCIEAWEAIWKMEASDLGGKRRYIADFELYDERAADHNNVTLDIFVGIE